MCEDNYEVIHALERGLGRSGAVHERVALTLAAVKQPVKPASELTQPSVGRWWIVKDECGRADDAMLRRTEREDAPCLSRQRGQSAREVWPRAGRAEEPPESGADSVFVGQPF